MYDTINKVVFFNHSYMHNIVKNLLDIENNIKANFWIIPDAYHVDGMFINPEEYGIKMKEFFLKHLN